MNLLIIVIADNIYCIVTCEADRLTVLSVFLVNLNYYSGSFMHLYESDTCIDGRYCF